MAYTYMQIVNDVLGELNEVLLTQDTFADATNIQLVIKEFVNRAYYDLNNPTNKWPWLAVASSLENNYGNKFVDVEAGTKWYLMNDASSDINNDYGFVDWSHFHLTTRGVAGETEPYTTRKLTYIEVEEWYDHFSVTEINNQDNSSHWTVPRRVIRSPDNRKFGLSPTPDKAYRVYFFAYKRPVALQYYNDEIVIPDQYYPVLVSRARYYAWQRKENPPQAEIALAEYKEGLASMRKQEVSTGPDRFTDDRVRYV